MRRSVCVFFLGLCFFMYGGPGNPASEMVSAGEPLSLSKEADVSAPTDEIKDDTGKSYPTIVPFGFMHIWAQYDTTNGASRGEDYSVPRLRFGIKGNLTEEIDYMVLSEWGKLTFEDPATLLDAWVNYKFSPLLNVRLGQFWYKFTYSGTTPLPKIPFIWRPKIIDNVWLSMGRNGVYSYDKGMEIWGQNKSASMPWGYFFSVTTGTGFVQEQFEDNEKKDFAARLWFEPRKGLRLGVSGFYGWSRNNIASSPGGLTKEEDTGEYAYGGEISYSRQKCRFIAEYLEALYEGFSNTTGVETYSLATRKPRGWYAMFGWKPVAWLEVPIRYEWYEKDSCLSDTGLETVTVGLTWYLKENTLNNIKINYLIRNAEGGYGSKPKNLFAVQVQLAF